MATAVRAEFRFDPWSAEYQRDLHDVHRVLRDEHPVYRDPEGRFFALSRFADVWDVVHDPARFSNRVPVAATLPPMILYMDPPRHARLRALVSRAFTARRIAALEPWVRETARGLLDAMVRRPDPDARRDFAGILPSVVIARMIGVPDAHVPAFRRWAEAFLEGDWDDAVARILRLFAEILAERRRAPRDDLMSALLEAEVDGAKLAEEEVLGFCSVLISAGNDTTASFIGNCLALLDRHPAERARLRRDPGLLPNAIEEMLRYETPTQLLSRTALRDAERHGVRIPAGSLVHLLWGAANHDEREFADPGRLDLGRRIERHLAFGHGIHYCIGANLARLETRVALEEWLVRFPDYALDGDPPRLVSFWARAYERIPVRLA